MQRVTGSSVGGSYLVYVLIIVAAMLSTSLAYAEQSVDSDPTPTPVIDAPVIPAPAESEPEITPTEVPPVEVEPEDEIETPPAPDAPVIPAPVTPEETIESDIEAEGTPAATELSPTEQTSTMIWIQSNPISCELYTGEHSGLGYAESHTYRCDVAADVSSDLALPADMTIAWVVNVDFVDDHALQLSAESLAEVTSQVVDGTATHYVIAHPWQEGSAQSLVFDIVLTRTTCAVGEQTLGVQALPEISAETSGVEIVQSDDSATPSSYAVEFLPNLVAPNVTMGAVDFGTLKWDGESWGSSRAVSTIAVSNPDPCGTSQAHTIELRINAEDAGMQPTLVRITAADSAITVIDGGGTSIATIPVGFSGSETIEVEFELEPTLDSPAGNHTFGFEVTVLTVP